MAWTQKETTWPGHLAPKSAFLKDRSKLSVVGGGTDSWLRGNMRGPEEPPCTHCMMQVLLGESLHLVVLLHFSKLPIPPTAQKAAVWMVWFVSGKRPPGEVQGFERGCLHPLKSYNKKRKQN